MLIRTYVADREREYITLLTGQGTAGFKTFLSDLMLTNFTVGQARTAVATGGGQIRAVNFETKALLSTLTISSVGND